MARINKLSTIKAITVIGPGASPRIPISPVTRPDLFPSFSPTPPGITMGGGGFDLGGLISGGLGVLERFFRGRLPVPGRPRLPGRVPTGRGRIPIPIPIPLPGDIFGGDQECPRGFHKAKDGSGRCVRNRRMNSLNPRALNRSLRRIEGFQRFVKRSGLVRAQIRRPKRKRRSICP